MNNFINDYFDGIRKAFNVKGILIYNEKSILHRIKIVGYPYLWFRPANDNEAKK